MRVIYNEDTELVTEIERKIKENGGYCPCKVLKNVDTKCMCKKFRDQLAQGYLGECECGLYKSITTVIYLYGDPYYMTDFIHWSDYFSRKGYLVLFPSSFEGGAKTEEERANVEITHKQKIQFSDTIFIIDRYGDLEPMKEVIFEAKRLGKNIMYASETNLK